MEQVQFGVETVPILLLTFIFLMISIIHIYWVVGGKWGYKAAIPQKFYEQLAAHGSRNLITLPTLMVALVMLFLSYVSFSHLPIVDSLIPAKLLNILSWGVVIVFLLRGIGDFNYVGLFQKKTDYIFSVNDRKYFSPLCLLVVGLMLVVLLT